MRQAWWPLAISVAVGIAAFPLYWLAMLWRQDAGADVAHEGSERGQERTWWPHDTSRHTGWEDR